MQKILYEDGKNKLLNFKNSILKQENNKKNYFKENILIILSSILLFFVNIFNLARYLIAKDDVAVMKFGVDLGASDPNSDFYKDCVAKLENLESIAITRATFFYIILAISILGLALLVYYNKNKKNN